MTLTVTVNKGEARPLEEWIASNDPAIVAEAIEQWLALACLEPRPIPVFLVASTPRGWPEGDRIALKGWIDKDLPPLRGCIIPAASDDRWETEEVF